MAKVILRAGKVGIRIVLPLVVFVIVLYLVKVMTVAQVAGPSDPATLLREGQTYQRTGQVAQAEQCYLDIIGQYQATSHAFAAEKSLATLYINEQDTASAMESVQRLLADFSENEELPHAIHFIVEQSRKSRNCETMRTVCQGLLDLSPQSSGALWVQMGVALSNSYLGDDKALDAAVQNLAANFPADRRGAEAFGQIAWSYRKQKKYQRARELYQYIVDNRPGDDRAIFSQRGLVYVNLSLDDQEAASEAVDGLLRNFSQSPYLAECVRTIAKKYQDMKKYDVARNLYAYAVENFTGTEDILTAQVGLVTTSIRLGDNVTAISTIEQLITENSENNQIAEVVCQIADGCRKEKLYDLSAGLYSYVVDSWPNAEHALWSEVGLIALDIALDNDPNAEDKTQQLLADYAGDIRLSDAAGRIGDEFRRANKFRQARDIYQYQIDNWPDVKDTISSRTSLATASIDFGDQQTAADAVDDLLLNYMDDERIATAVCRIANHYSRRGKDHYARQVYDYFLDNWSNPDLEIWARAVEVNAAGAAADPNAIDWLMADFAGHRRLAEAVFCISERFYNRALDFERKGASGQAREYFERALKGWETIVGRLPKSPYKTSQACQLAGDCYRRLGQHEKAVPYYEYIVQSWPHSEAAWNAQYMIGYSYERLKKGGVVPREEADAIIEAAYAQLLEAYPDCPAAKAARNWLKHNVATGKGGRG